MPFSNVFSYSCVASDKMLTDTALRAIAELLVAAHRKTTQDQYDADIRRLRCTEQCVLSTYGGSTTTFMVWCVFAFRPTIRSSWALSVIVIIWIMQFNAGCVMRCHIWPRVYGLMFVIVDCGATDMGATPAWRAVKACDQCDVVTACQSSKYYCLLKFAVFGAWTISGRV